MRAKFETLHDLMKVMDLFRECGVNDFTVEKETKESFPFDIDIWILNFYQR